MMSRATLAAVLLAAGAMPSYTQPSEPFQISVNVDLVVLQATVSDRGGRFPPELAARDFEIYEDGVKQSIRLFRHEDLPVTVGLVIDHSGSMRRKLPEVVAAALTFARASNARDKIFVINFNDHVATAMSGASPFLSLPSDLQRAILDVPAVGMTKLYDAVFQAQDQLRSSDMEKKVLIVISDGGDNASAHTLAAVLKNAEISPALIYTIGVFDEYDTEKNKEVLRKLARFTGGEAFFPAELDGTVAICGQIARDIRNQYTLGYVSSNTAKTGKIRAIHVTASEPGHGKLTVRTRSGYIAGAK